VAVQAVAEAMVMVAAVVESVATAVYCCCHCDRHGRPARLARLARLARFEAGHAHMPA